MHTHIHTYILYNIEGYARRHKLPFLESFIRLNQGLNYGLLNICKHFR